MTVPWIGLGLGLCWVALAGMVVEEVRDEWRERRRKRRGEETGE